MLDHRRERAGLAAHLADERSVSDELRRQLAIAETAGDIDRATYSQVESHAGRPASARFRRRKKSSCSIAASFRRRTASRAFESKVSRRCRATARAAICVRLLLVQAIVHSRRVSGAVKLQLEGMQDGQTASFDAAELVVPGEPYDMAYEFRYFQGLETELALPVGFEPQRMTSKIWPNEARAERINQTFEWPAIAG